MSTLKWDNAFVGKVIRELNVGVAKMAAVLEAEMTVTLNTKRVSQRRIVGKTVASMTKSGAVRLDKSMNAIRKWRQSATWGSAKDLQGNLVPFDRGRLSHVGRVYWAGRGSPPGTPPYIRSGRLKGSIDFAMPTEFFTRVGSSMPYARRLEFGYVGTDSLGRQYHDPPRPWARPSVVKAKPKMLEVFQAHMKERIPQLLGSLV